MSYEPIRITLEPPIVSKDGKEKITHVTLFDPTQCDDEDDDELA